MLSDRKASGRDVATAVRGIGELAAPTLKFYGQEVCMGAVCWYQLSCQR